MAVMEQYKCPACGGALEFSPELQKMKCPYCESEFDIDLIKEVSETEAKIETDDKMDSWSDEAGNSWSDEERSSVRTYSCKSCGGEIIADINTGATTCPYCGNNVVVNDQFAETLKPDLIIPFKLNKDAAKSAFLNHLSGKKLLPKFFKEDTHIDEIKGIYVPFWLYNADVDGSVKYSATKVRHWSSGKYDYTETKYYEIFREGGIAFHDIPVDASSKMPDDLMDSLEPFDLADAVDFNSAYFAGYLADKYDVSIDENIPRINTRVKHSTEDVFKTTVTEFYDTLSVKNSYIDLKNGNAKYALLPIWLMNTTWKGEKFIFAMNGQTGKFVGNLPMDKKLYWKYWLISFLASIPVGIIIGLIAKFFMD